MMPWHDLTFPKALWNIGRISGCTRGIPSLRGRAVMMRHYATFHANYIHRSHLREGVLLLCSGDLGSRSHRSDSPSCAWPGKLQQLIMCLPVQQLLALCETVAVLLLTADSALDGWCGC